MIEQTPEGYWVIQGETHMNGWVRECKRLDHDQHMIPIACAQITRGTVVIDVGANIGTHTIAYLQACGPEGLVVAYEPNPVAFACLERNCPTAMLMKCAVGEKLDTCKLNALVDNVGASYLSPDGEVPVMRTSLDRDFKNILAPAGWKTISFIKIDVEGCEPEVLRGAEKLITQYRPIILLEVNPGALERQNHKAKEIADFMEAHLYQIQFIPETCNWGSPQSELLCRPL